jgi:cytochrome c oxidase subunit III
MSEPSTEPATGAKHAADPHPGAHVPHDDHDDAMHAEHPFLAHHFDTPQQQFDAGKLGIWLFLVTEVLFFAGLFCAYTIYRAQNPEVFVYAHYHLDTNLGAINTTVLLGSSLTAAWAVRCAQLRQKRGLIINIAVTIACACTFMVIKYFEYSHKAHEGLLWGKNFDPKHEPWQLESFKKKHPEAAELAHRLKAKTPGEPKPSTAPAELGSAPQGTAAVTAQAAAQGAPAGAGAPAVTTEPTGAATPPADAPEAAAQAGDDTPGLDPTPPGMETAPADQREAQQKRAEMVGDNPGLTAPSQAAATGPARAELPEKISEAAIRPLVDAGMLAPNTTEITRPRKAHIFFGIYFFMTGLHGLHVLIGIGVWIWMLVRATRGVFGPSYFGPIDFTALYWHLVDLIWIYLFPLLYLIH